MSTNLSLAATNSSSQLTPKKSLLKSFISNFTSETFFAEIASIALYPADFGSSGTLMKSDSITNYFKDFLKDLVITTLSWLLINPNNFGFKIIKL